MNTRSLIPSWHAGAGFGMLLCVECGGKGHLRGVGRLLALASLLERREDYPSPPSKAEGEDTQGPTRLNLRYSFD
jgi:hypothetical protein